MTAEAVQTKIVPFSSVVGQSVLLLDGAGRVVAQLNIHSTQGADYKAASGKVAKRIEAAFRALSEAEIESEMDAQNVEVIKS
jgi:hypothetical protein